LQSARKRSRRPSCAPRRRRLARNPPGPRARGRSQSSGELRQATARRHRACAFARNEFGLTNIFEGNEEIIEKQFLDNYFDVVVALDVIEHVYDPESFFAIVNKKLKSGGLFVLTTPIIDSLTARILKKRWHALVPSHLNYFTYGFLKRFYGRFGYVLVHKRFYLRHLSLNYLFTRLLRTSHARVPKFLNVTVPVNLFDEIEIHIRKK